MRKLLPALLILACISCKKEQLPFAPGTTVKLNTSRISYKELAQGGVVPTDPLKVVRWYQKYGEDGYWYILNDAHTAPLVIDLDGRDVVK